jgi:hypothetical protein
MCYCVFEQLILQVILWQKLAVKMKEKYLLGLLDNIYQQRDSRNPRELARLRDRRVGRRLPKQKDRCCSRLRLSATTSLCLLHSRQHRPASALDLGSAVRRKLEIPRCRTSIFNIYHSRTQNTWNMLALQKFSHQMKIAVRKILFRDTGVQFKGSVLLEWISALSTVYNEIIYKLTNWKRMERKKIQFG